MNGSILKYLSIYGDELRFDTVFENFPSINGISVNFAPIKVFEGPFLNTDYDNGVVEIKKGDRPLVLDFNRSSIRSLGHLIQTVRIISGISD